MARVVRVSEELELALVHGLVTKRVRPDAVKPEELSKHGRMVHTAVQELETITAESVLLYGVDVLGANRSAFGDYLKRAASAGQVLDPGEILQRVHDKQLLTEIYNEAGNQIGGRLDLTAIASLLEQRRRSGGDTVVSVSDRLEAEGMPAPPRGLRIRTLPGLAELTGGVIGMWTFNGEPGLGKSTLAWQVLVDVTNAENIPGLYYDQENGFGVMMDRMRQLYEGDVSKISRALRNVYYRDSIRTLDRDLHVVSPPAVVVVDSVQKLPASIVHRRTGLDQWIHRLEFLKKRGYYVILVSEVARSQYGSDPYIGAAKETGEIEYSSDVVLQLSPYDTSSIELHITKNRHRPFKGQAGLLQRANSWLWKEVRTMADLPQEELE
jgi:hypothetical protein